MARKIEVAMIDAIRDRRAWHSGNTAVTLDARQDDKPLALVYLHGNHIATIGYTWAQGYAGQWGVVSVSGTLAGWNSRTTRSRLTAICHAFDVCTAYGVAVKNGAPYVARKDGTRELVEHYSRWFNLSGGR